MRFPQGWELIVVLAVVVLLFGTKKLPDAARGLGRSLRIFKSEIKTMQDEDEPTTRPSTPAEPKAIPASENDAPTTQPGQNEPRPETPPRVDG